MILHVLNGDCTRGVLRLSRIPGDTTVWADVLYDGPVPDVPAHELRELRGSHLASDAGETEREVVQTLRSWDDRLERFADYDEVVFWFEHDLFDQLILIRHLHWLSQIERGRTTFTLICIGEFPGIPGFAGLGQLNPPQLASLFPTRRAITDEQIELGRRAWDLFRADDPDGLWSLMSGGHTDALPFLDGALRRYFEDFPWASDGLSRSERQILQVVDAGATKLAEVFVATQDMEERIFMGDLTFWSIMRGLASAAHPLLTREPDSVRLTSTGMDVLAGRADHIVLNGLDKWMGGVHLVTDRHWRWDGGRLIRVNS